MKHCKHFHSHDDMCYSGTEITFPTVLAGQESLKNMWCSIVQEEIYLPASEDDSNMSSSLW